MSVKMRVLWMCLLLLSEVYIVKSSTVRLVRLVDHTSYAVAIVQKTMSRVEQRQWCNLKVDDLHVGLSENVLGDVISAEINLQNGFVSSIQKIDIVQSTIQQVWLPVRVNTTMVEVRATVRMHNVAIGYDVTTKMDEQTFRSTGVIVYPEIQFPFTITKHLFTDELEASVVSSLIRTTNRLEFLPENEVTKLYTVLFDWNSTFTSISRWASDIFTPIVLQLATEEVEFPRICYDCAA